MIRPDNVASHSYYVAVYSRMIAKVIDWRGNVGNLLTYSLLDDVDEIVTGDITGPVKQEIIDRQRAAEFVENQLDMKMPQVVEMIADVMDGDEYNAIRRIVKAADRMDALFFLMTDRRLGNRNIDNRIRDATAKLEAAWRDLPADDDAINMTWQTVVIPAIAAHDKDGGDGVW